MSNEFEKELNWDDEIEKDSQEFTLLPEGIYDFRLQASNVPGTPVVKNCPHVIKRSFSYVSTRNKVQQQLDITCSCTLSQRAC